MGKSTFLINPHLRGHLPPRSQGPADSPTTSRPPMLHHTSNPSLAYAIIGWGHPYQVWWSTIKVVDVDFGAEAWLWDQGVKSHNLLQHLTNLSFLL